MKNIHNGIFISLEGIEGCGKSTQSRLLYNYLKECGEDVVLTHEPGGCEISEEIREILKDCDHKNMSNMTELLLIYAARAQHVYEVIRPALERGAIVISDRFNNSSFAYQGYGRGMNMKSIKAINDITLNGLKPDVTFFMNMTQEQGFIRKAKPEKNRFEQENLAFFDRVYNGFIKIARKDKTIITIDANRPVSEILAEIINYLTKLNVICEKVIKTENSKEENDA